MTASVASSVVRQLRLRKQISRVDLARQLDVAPSTVGIHVDRLVDDGFVREGEFIAKRTGRPPQVVELNPDAGQFVGIDLDAREIYGVSINFAQQVIRNRTAQIRSTDSAKEVVQRIADAIRSVRDPSRELLGIGLAVPGTVDTVRKVALHYAYIRGWRELPIADAIERKFQVPVSVENNIRAMALAERGFGKTRTTANSICIGIRTGIGSGVMIGGELLRGEDDLAGEIGGWPIETSSGNVTTLESVASLRAILAKAKQEIQRGRRSELKLKRNRVELGDLLAAATNQDKLTTRILNDAAISLGRAIAQVSLLLNPERVVLCGPLAGLKTSFVTPVRESVARFLPAFHSRVPELEASDLGDTAGALGASSLAASQWAPI